MFCKVLCEKLSSTIKIFGIFRKAVAAVGAVVCDWLGESMKMFLALDLHQDRVGVLSIFGPSQDARTRPSSVVRMRQLLVDSHTDNT